MNPDETKNTTADASETQPSTLPVWTPTEGKALVLRVCRKGGVSEGARRELGTEFIWPLEPGAEVSAPDWSPAKICGRGLHGWLWGVGDVVGAGAEYGFTDPDAVWLVVEVDTANVVELTGKVKYPSGRVLYVGPVKECISIITPHAPAGASLIAGTASAGDSGTASAGDSGTASAGNYGTASAGDIGTILIKRWDDNLLRYRWVMGEVGLDGIEANVPYVLDEHGKLVKKAVTP